MARAANGRAAAFLADSSGCAVVARVVARLRCQTLSGLRLPYVGVYCKSSRK